MQAHGSHTPVSWAARRRVWAVWGPSPALRPAPHAARERVSRAATARAARAPIRRAAQPVTFRTHSRSPRLTRTAVRDLVSNSMVGTIPTEIGYLTALAEQCVARHRVWALARCSPCSAPIRRSARECRGHSHPRCAEGTATLAARAHIRRAAAAAQTRLPVQSFLLQFPHRAHPIRDWPPDEPGHLVCSAPPPLHGCPRARLFH